MDWTELSWGKYHREESRETDYEPGGASSSKRTRRKKVPGWHYKDASSPSEGAEAEEKPTDPSTSGAQVLILPPSPHPRWSGVGDESQAGWGWEEKAGRGSGSKPQPCLLPALSALVFLFDQTCQVCFGKPLSLGRLMGNEGVQISQRAIVTTQPTALHLCSELPEAGRSAILGPQVPTRLLSQGKPAELYKSGMWVWACVWVCAWVFMHTLTWLLPNHIENNTTLCAGHIVEMNQLLSMFQSWLLVMTFHSTFCTSYGTLLYPYT